MARHSRSRVRRRIRLPRRQDRYRAKTGLPLSTYFSGLKIRWILEEVSGARMAAESGDLLFGNIDTFLIWNLTGGISGGVHVTDVTNASRTQLMNLNTLDWDDEILRDFDIPRAILPRIASSSEVYGHAALDSVRGVPIAGDLGDHKLPSLARHASNPARPRTLTAPAALC